MVLPDRVMLGDSMLHLTGYPVSMDDLQAAAKARDAGAAKAAWTRGKDYLNEYLYLINLPISAKVGDKFKPIKLGVNDKDPPPPPPQPPPEPLPAAEGDTAGA